MAQVRYIGMAKRMLAEGPSGTTYTFHRGETIEVDAADWNWCVEHQQKWHLELIEAPAPPVIEEAPPEQEKLKAASPETETKE